MLNRKTALVRLLCLTLICCLLAVRPVMAEEVSWPEADDIQADGGILMDAGSGAILYEKNADQAYYPASITKILTALIVIENCDLDEMVTFSYNAVYNVEAGSSNMGVLDGDQLSVRDCLYGMMLASANEAANALAEHCAGSIDAFADMMNEKAAELGCTGSHFVNPSGLNDEDHYTTARDMALITQAALANPTFVEIDSALYWKHAPIQRYPDPDDPGNTVYAHHAMLKKNDSRYYAGAFAGKTGYTSLAGNTLVTAAERDGMTLICVILNGHQTHYQDTKSLLDFGFQNFKSVNVSDSDSSYPSIQDDLTISGLSLSAISSLVIDSDCSVTLPKTADLSDAKITIQNDPGDNAPDGAAARIIYTFAGHTVGSSWLQVHQTTAASSLVRAAASLAASEAVGIPEPTTKAAESLTEEAADAGGAALSSDDAAASPGDSVSGTDETDSPAVAESSPALAKEAKEDLSNAAAFTIPPMFWPAAAAVLLLAAIITAAILIRMHREKQEEQERFLRRERRKQRLQDIGFTREEFDRLVEGRRQSSPRRKR